jgi:hypothetical protein
MNNFSEIGQAVGDINLAMEGNSRNFEEQAKISTPEAVPTLQATVDSLISDNVKLRERLSAIEAKLMTIDVEFNKLSEDSSIELPNKATVCEREKRLAMNQHAIGQTSELPDGNIDFSDSYFPRTLDIKDRMIADQQERRERTHEAVDDVEIYAKGSTWYVGPREDLVFFNYQ